MITTEVFEATDDYPYKEIFYRDSRDIAIKHTIIDSNGKLVRESLSEYDDKGKCICDIVYADDGTTKLGYREYDYDDYGQEIGYRDYHVTNSTVKLILLNRSIWIETGKKLHSIFYDDTYSFLGYQLFEYEEPYGMICNGSFDMTGQRIDPNIFPVYNKFN